MKRQVALLTISAWLSMPTIYASGQGGLVPPGAPAETMKTLQQVEPRTDVMTLVGNATYEFVIRDSGSYYLSDNLRVTKTSGILIDDVDVVLDLNGFTISRASDSGGEGIRIDGAMDGATVRNGTVSGFGFGIRCYSAPAYARACRIEGVVVSDCSNYGIRAGESSTIVDCRAFDNQGTAGIYADDTSTIRGCAAYENQVTYAIRTDVGSSIVNCQVSENKGNSGIYALNTTGISGCSAYGNNVKYGMYAGSGSTFRECDARGNYWGDTSSYGIYLHSQGAVLRCVARSNSNTNAPTTTQQGVGIFVGDKSTVTDCSAILNRGDGIRVTSNCLAARNTCLQNGQLGDGAGIHVTFGSNRIDANTVVDNDRGIDVDSTLNLIVRNSARDNGTDYDIGPSNRDAQVLTPGSGFVSSDPWANFSY